MLFANRSFAQEDAGQEIVKLHYYNSNNSIQYLILESTLKKNKVFTPQKDKTYQIYLDSAGTNLIAKVKTDAAGKGKAFLPPTLKKTWDASPQHTFIVKAGDEEIISDFIITKAKITIDTLNLDGIKSIVATVFKFENNTWTPAKDVEMKVGIQRHGGVLSAGDEETYTTDSTGSVTAEFKKLNLPGNQKGDITLVAKVEENEFFGNLAAQKSVKWGVPTKVDTHFFEQRTLWTTRFKTPYWLLFMAYSIIIGVWGTLIYLVRQVIKIKKLGS
jgi:hypothetical protein